MVDTATITQVLAAAALGGMIGLDRTAVGQFMFSQPVVAAPLTGWILGDVTAGIAIGVSLELLWVLDLPIGTFVPADATVAAVASTAIAAIGGGGAAGPDVIGFCLLLTTVMVPFTMFADHLMRQRNAQIPELAMGKEGMPSESRVTGWHLAGLIAFFLKTFVLCLGMIPAGLAVLHLFRGMPEVFHRAMTLYVALLPLLGAAAVARKLSAHIVDRSLLIGCCAAAVCVLFMQLPAVIAVIAGAGAGWVGVRIGGK